MTNSAPQTPWRTSSWKGLIVEILSCMWIFCSSERNKERKVSNARPRLMLCRHSTRNSRLSMRTTRASKVCLRERTQWSGASLVRGGGVLLVGAARCPCAFDPPDEPIYGAHVGMASDHGAAVLRGKQARDLFFFLAEVREFIRDKKPITNTTRGGRRARYPKTTLPHRPPGALAALSLLGGRPRAPARFGGG